MNYKSYKSYDSHVKQTHTKHKYLKTKCINTALKYKCKKKVVFFSYLFLCLFRNHSEPVSNHAQDSSKISKSYEDPKPHDRLIEV